MNEKGLNNKSIMVAFLALAIGFAIAWFAKPSGVTYNEVTHHQNESSDGSKNTDVDQIWTCSMHPQIRQNEPGQCPICAMDLVPLDADVHSDDPRILQMTVEAAKLAEIETIILGGAGQNQNASAENEELIPVEGKIELDERSILTQTAHIGGRIEKMYIGFTGEYVSKGQKIARVYSTDILAASRELLTAKKYEKRVSGVLEAAKQKLRNWNLSEAQIEEISNKGEELSTIYLYAESSGYVIKKMKSTGEYVQTGGSLYTLANTSRLWVIFNVFEKDLSEIRKGQKIEFKTSAIPDKIFTSSINYINPLLSSSSNTAEIRASISNAGNHLKPGMLVAGNIFRKNKSQGISKKLQIPKSAVLWTGPRSVVYIKVPDSEIPGYTYREVDIKELGGLYYEVLKGLEAGDEVVVNGAFVIDAAAQLNNKYSMMNKNIELKRTNDPNHLPDYTEQTPIEFKRHLAKVSDAYLSVKDALVATNATQTRAGAKQLVDMLATVDMTLVKGSAHRFWMEQQNALKAHSEKISELGDIEEQRKQFDYLSQALIKSLKVFGVDDDTLYIQHCPMVGDNNGADWISGKQEIRNPYFGDKMLTCGSIQDTIDKNFRNPPMQQQSNPRQNIHNH